MSALVALSELAMLSSCTDCTGYSPSIAHIPATNSVTELISINFTDTLPLNSIWPSDGIALKYSLTDYRKPPNGAYTVFFSAITVSAGGVSNTSDYCYGMIGDEKYNMDNFYNYPVYRIQLDVSHCETCNTHSCLHCEQQVKLFNFLSHLPPISLPPNTYDFGLSHPYAFDVLITPLIMTVHLQRCNISFFTEATKDKSAPVHLFFNLSSNCYDRVGSIYKVSILQGFSGTENELLIEIEANHLTSSTLCKRIDTDCASLQQDNSFTMSLEEDELLGTTAVFFSSNSMDVYVSRSAKSATSHFIKDEVSSVPFWQSTAFYASVITPLMCGICVFCWWQCVKYRRYMNAFVVDNALVLIVGIAQFEDKKLVLPGVEKNVSDLRNLWEKQYKYDVFVCNEQYLYSTKDDILQFIDDHKVKLEDNRYQSFILHIISHGSNKGQTFLTSDQRNIALVRIQHELIKSANKRYIAGHQEQPLIKIIFAHICRGQYNYSSDGECLSKKKEDVTRVSNVEDEMKYNENEYAQSEFSDWAILWGNITGRTVSDKGHFTDCICNEFAQNAGKKRKDNFRELITRIGIKLQSKTDAAEICEISETFRQKDIRFEPSSMVTKQQHVTKDIVKRNMYRRGLDDSVLRHLM
eukprot:225408_1